MPEQPGPFIPPTVVVGVDGSRAGVRAAVWAIDEATSRDIPLHLLAVTDDTAGTPRTAPPPKPTPPCTRPPPPCRRPRPVRVWSARC